LLAKKKKAKKNLFFLPQLITLFSQLHIIKPQRALCHPQLPVEY